MFLGHCLPHTSGLERWSSRPSPRCSASQWRDCDHRSQPDVWGNNDCKHRIKPLNNIELPISPSTVSDDYIVPGRNVRYNGDGYCLFCLGCTINFSGINAFTDMSIPTISGSRCTEILSNEQNFRKETKWARKRQENVKYVPWDIRRTLSQITHLSYMILSWTT